MAGDKSIQQLDAGQNRIQSFAFIIAVLVCVLFCVFFEVSSFSRLRQTCEVKLDSRLNPNDAPVESLVRLPGIGPGKAGAIVAYRKGFAERQGQGQAFQNCDDLQKVRGIGPKTAKNISELLKFE